MIQLKSYLSGSTVRSQSQLRASDAEILLLGSNASILSKRSNAGSGIKWLKSSRRRLRYCFLFCLMFWKCGRLITSGQLAGHGVPHSLDITKSWANSSLAYWFKNKWYNRIIEKRHLCFTKKLSGKKYAGTHGFDKKMMVKSLAFFSNSFQPNFTPRGLDWLWWLKAIHFVNSVCTIFSLWKQDPPHQTFPS